MSDALRARIVSLAIAGAAALILLALALLALSGDDDPASAQAGQGAGPPREMHVEMAITASEARWIPRERGGRLTLSGVDPRMAVMASAPRREIAVLPVSQLRANWNELFKTTDRKTNVVLGARMGDRPVLIPLRARLVASHVSGERLVFEVGALRRVAHRPDRLPAHRRLTLEDPTLLVDPSVTDAITAMWNALTSFFSGTTFSVPPDPTGTSPDGNTLTYDDGGELPGGEVYKGPSSATITNAEQWEQVQRQIFDEAGPYRGFDFQGNPFGELTFTGNSYDGLAIIPSPNDYRNIVFQGPGERMRVENSAIFGVQTDGLRFTDADVGGMNMRGTQAPQFSAENTLFDTVDVTGATIGGTLDGPRSNVENAAFVGVRNDLSGEQPDGSPDRFNDRALNVSAIDFTSVTFVDSTFQGGEFRDATFQGCGFQNVDFSGARFVGTDPAQNNDRFQPTFDNSIMEGVNFNEVRFQDVSFAGVDFSGGRVTLDGATLNNVDFTGATGLQFIDWTKVTVEGNVYGLHDYAHIIGDLANGDLIRGLTFDGVAPEIDEATQMDIEPGTGYLIDPDTGVRLERNQFNGRLTPIDPATGEPMENPRTGDPLVFEPGGVFDPVSNERFDVDYATGRLEA